MDRLTGQREEFQFGKWIEDAVSWGETEEEKALFDYNATALITIWGRDEEAEIFDYAWREWSGLIESYYKMRWEYFFQMLSECLEKGTEYNEEVLSRVHGREKWRASPFYSWLADREVAWIHERKAIKKRKAEDIDCLVAELIGKYDTV